MSKYTFYTVNIGYKAKTRDDIYKINSLYYNDDSRFGYVHIFDIFENELDFTTELTIKVWAESKEDYVEVTQKAVQRYLDCISKIFPQSNCTFILDNLYYTIDNTKFDITKLKGYTKKIES